MTAPSEGACRVLSRRALARRSADNRVPGIISLRSLAKIAISAMVVISSLALSQVALEANSSEQHTWLSPLISRPSDPRDAVASVRSLPNLSSAESDANATAAHPTDDTDDDDNDDQRNARLTKDEIRESRRRLFVRQLADLIMNSDPEVIGARLSGHADERQPEPSDPFDAQLLSLPDLFGAADSEEQVRRHQSSETTSIDKLRAQSAVEVSSSYHEEGAADHATSGADSGAELPLMSTGGSPTGDEFEGQDAGSQTVTCPPDYDDQVMMDAGGNLTAEEQRQLLAGMDNSGLLANTDSPSEANEDSGNGTLGGLTTRIPRPLMGQCIHAGSRTIEIITKTITPILFGIIIVVGLLGNIIVMLVILEDRKTDRELTPTNLLILDLSLADLSFIIFCIPFTGWDYAVGHWVFGPLWCKFNQYLIVVCALSSIYTLVLMSIDRFLAIVYPIECISYRTSTNMFYAIGIKWILILVIASPTVPMHGLIELPLGPDQYNCRFLSDQYNPLHFQITFFVTSYLFPLVLIFFLYLSVLNKLWFGTKPRGHRESNKMLESKKKVTFLVASIVIVFAICWCPIQVMLILMRLKTHKITATYVAIQVFSHILGYMNSCVNPIVYAFASETFTNSFKRSSPGRLCHRLIGRPAQHGNTNGNNLHDLDCERTTTHVIRAANEAGNAAMASRSSRPSLSNLPHENNGTRIGNSANKGARGNNDHYLDFDENKYSSRGTTTTIVMSACPTNTVSLPLEPRDRDLL